MTDPLLSQQPPIIRAMVHIARRHDLLDLRTTARWAKSLARNIIGTRAELIEYLDSNPFLDEESTKRIRPYVLVEDLYIADRELLCPLGHGGMGQVYLAQNAQNLEVIKVLRRDLLDEKNFTERFEREYQLHTKVQSPYVIGTLGYGLCQIDEQDHPYLITEFASGGDLGRLIATRGPLKEIEALALIRHLALGLQAAHEAGLLHRDIKPANAFLTGTGQARLADFGLARPADPNASGLSITGDAMGTPHFMSPECIQGTQTIDIRSDIYALGAVLIFALTGNPPYQGPKGQVILDHLESAVPNVKEIDPSLSQETADLCSRCMAKSPDDRPETPASVAAACLAIGRHITAEKVSGS